MKLPWAHLPLLLTASCRQPIVVDTSAAKLIPRDVAIDRLKDALASADMVVCSAPKNTLEKAEIKEWKVDDLGLEALAEGKEPIRVAFKDVTATRLDKFYLYFQLRIFTAAQANPKKDYVHFHFATEEKARRALELLDALWQKP